MNCEETVLENVTSCENVNICVAVLKFFFLLTPSLCLIINISNSRERILDMLLYKKLCIL